VPNLNDGTIERADLDGGNRKVIIPQGVTFTPKQLHLEKGSGKLYWCDREGMRVMRANLDGTNVETLVKSGEGDDDRRDATKWCVGITIDPKRRQIYWTQKGPIMPASAASSARAWTFPKAKTPPVERTSKYGSTTCLNRSTSSSTPRTRPLLDGSRQPAARQYGQSCLSRCASRKRTHPERIVSDLMEGIGIALDVPGDRMFITDFGGSVYSAKLDGSEKRAFLSPRQPIRRRIRRNHLEGELTMAGSKPISQVAIIGTGVIGASWAAFFLAKGLDVVATDIAPTQKPSLNALSTRPGLRSNGWGSPTAPLRCGWPLPPIAGGRQWRRSRPGERT
jgi:hypothetical protein